MLARLGTAPQRRLQQDALPWPYNDAGPDAFALAQHSLLPAYHTTIAPLSPLSAGQPWCFASLSPNELARSAGT